MKKIIVLAMFMVLWVIMPTQGRAFEINENFNAATGDAEFDTYLKNMNSAAGKKINVFVKDISSTYNVAPKMVRYLLYKEEMQPADVFMTLQSAKISDKPLHKVGTQFEQQRGNGWGAIAKSVGIKPGSEKFMSMKERIPRKMQKYEETNVKGSKGKKYKKGSKGKKHKQYKKGSKGSKGKKHKRGSKGKKHKKGSKGKKN